MTKVIKDELLNANNSLSVKALDELSRNSTYLANIIDGFIQNSTDKLLGNCYDAIRKKLSIYSMTLKMQSKICQTIYSLLPSANNYLVGYMEDFSELDDSNLSDIEANISKIKNIIERLRLDIKSMNMIVNSDLDINYNDNSFNELYLNCYNIIYKELLKLENKIKYLKDNDNIAFNKISDYSFDVTKLNNIISEIQVFKI